MDSEFIKAGGELVNVAQIARATWRGDELFLNTSGGYLRLQGREASMVWALLEERLTFDAVTGDTKAPK